MSSKGQSHQVNFLLRYSLQSFGVVVLLAALLRIFFFSSFVMSGESMLPSVWTGDFLLGTKWGLSRVVRGDVVVLRCPAGRDKLCLKRVVGLPGDRVEFRDGRLILNGESAEYRMQGVFAMERVGGRAWPVWPEVSFDLAPIVVPPDSYFLLNDKRLDRDDSRTWGIVTRDLLQARVRRVWLSLDWVDGNHVRTWPRVRWSRLMRAID